MTRAATAPRPTRERRDPRPPDHQGVTQLVRDVFGARRDRAVVATAGATTYYLLPWPSAAGLAAYRERELPAAPVELSRPAVAYLLAHGRPRRVAVDATPAWPLVEDHGRARLSWHARVRWHARFGAPQALRSAWQEAVPVGCADPARARYHPPTGALFLYVRRDQPTIVTVFPTPRAELVTDHLVECRDCRLLVDMDATRSCACCGGRTCPWCDASLDRAEQAT